MVFLLKTAYASLSSSTMAPTAKVNVRPTKSVLPTLDGQYLGTDHSPAVTGYSNTVMVASPTINEFRQEEEVHTPPTYDDVVRRLDFSNLNLAPRTSASEFHPFVWEPTVFKNKSTMTSPNASPPTPTRSLKIYKSPVLAADATDDAIPSGSHHVPSNMETHPGLYLTGTLSTGLTKNNHLSHAGMALGRYRPYSETSDGQFSTGQEVQACPKQAFR